MIDLKNIMQDKKKMMVVAVVLLAIIGIIIWLRRRKTESNYVEARGGFGGTTGSIAYGAADSVAPPPMAPPPPMPPPPDSPPGDGIMGMPPPPSGPIPPHPHPPHGGGGYPGYPIVPYYPAPVYYDPFPRTYVIDDAPAPRKTMSRDKYVAYLKDAINNLEDEYDDAVSDLMFGRAISISRQIRKMRSVLRTQLGFNYN